MKIETERENVLRVTAARQEMGALVAGARMALRLLQDDPSAPAAAREALARVIADYDAALAAMAGSRPRDRDLYGAGGAAGPSSAEGSSPGLSLRHSM